ncbi:unnamed protein product [Cylicostephanus goldi]|uniref:Uncharacterized protein n=1 Tax=Cylicostephanus goldi TaxID=71465 RepID=A0A3P7MSW6_CYLGO|nr:unnamed protein product [Cylicostephanus goldi]
MLVLGGVAEVAASNGGTPTGEFQYISSQKYTEPCYGQSLRTPMCGTVLELHLSRTRCEVPDDDGMVTFYEVKIIL